MSESEQIEKATQLILNQIDYMRSEFNLSVASVVGILEIVKHEIIQDGLDPACK